eukprot:11211474-Lingulodinium_polyedra.AAC.1
MISAMAGIGENMGQLNKKGVEEHLQWLEMATMEKKCEVIKHCRVEKTYVGELKKISLAADG